MTNNTSAIIYPQHDWYTLSRREQLDVIDRYYSNNSLYEDERLTRFYLGFWSETIRPLRTPTHRSVEFYVGKVAVGEPSVSANKAAVKDAVSKVLEWSNFQLQKPVQVREMALHGDVWRKVVSEGGKVWHEQIDSKDVTDFKESKRGFLTEIRLDTPIIVDGIQKIRTEFWTTEGIGYMAVWEHQLGDNAPIEQIQQATNPVEYARLSDFGIDFVPFVRASFQKNGTSWGMNSVEHALIKIDEANRQATRLHQMLFRYGKPQWLVSSNQVDDTGAPMPAPRMKQGTNSDKTNTEVRDDSIIYLPGVATVEALVPNVDYAAALSILLSQEKELVQDLPELLYYSIPDRADMSGKALRTLLGAAVDRALQAQSNYIESLVRANQMCLTIGEFLGIFSGLGSFDNGDLDHSIAFKDAFPLDESERATTLQAYITAGLPLEVAMKKVGFSQEEIEETMKLKAAQQPQPTQPSAGNDTVSTMPQQMPRQMTQAR